MLGLRIGSVIGGAAARGSQIIDDTRKNANDTVESLLRDWNRLGLPKQDIRKKRRVRMTGNMKFLKERGFSDDQIGAALYEADGGDAIVEHIKGLEKIDVDVPVADLLGLLLIIKVLALLRLNI